MADMIEEAIDCLVDTLEKQAQEIEQLKAQNAAMREVLGLVDRALQADTILLTCRTRPNDLWDRIKLTLSTDAADYHNPADVKALKQAREAIKFFSNHYSGTVEGYLDHKKVLQTIDKILGGGQD